MKRKVLAGLVLLSSLCTFAARGDAKELELFHSGTTGKCEGCHSVRGGNGARSGNEQQTVSLRGSDASSTCLLCHQAPAGMSAPHGHYVATNVADLNLAPPTQLTPGGDFGWLRKNYSWKGEGAGQERSPGEMHGHNIVAADYGYFMSDRKRVSPGGSYPAAALSCISCHDPHGNYRRNADGSISSSGAPIVASGSYNSSPNPDVTGSVGSYRLLAGKGYQLKSSSGNPFSNDPPAAVAPEEYNRSEGVTDTRVAYGSGMSEWCQNCHPSIHADQGSQHVSGNNAKMSLETTNNYNAYVRSGDLNGSAGSSYTSMVPYELGTDDYAVLKTTANSDGSNLGGPGTAGDRPNVMCLSCHRAHASGWDSMTRWNEGVTFLVEDGDYPGTDSKGGSKYAQGRTVAEVRKTFYDRPASRYATYQRSLCNKCHAKD